MGLDRTIKPADTMVQEYLHEKDLDGNGEIYGFDFVVANPPPILKTITRNVLDLDPTIRVDPELSVVPEEFDANYQNEILEKYGDDEE